jgi:chromosome partitioning protein
MILKPAAPSPVSTADLTEVAGRASDILTGLRDTILEPYPRKQQPNLNIARIAEICGIDQGRVSYRVNEGKQSDTPAGEFRGKSRLFKFGDARTLIRSMGGFPQRPQGLEGKIITVGALKGGVGKSVIATTLASALALRGYEVVLLDADPQASATQLLSWIPEYETLEEETILPFVYGLIADLSSVPVDTYLPGLRAIKGAPMVADGDYAIAAKMRDQKFEFWALMTRGLAPLKRTTDFIIVDVPPSISFATQSLMLASDALLVPCPPESLDFAASAAFMTHLSNLKSHENAKEVMKWIRGSYPDLMAESSIPFSDVITAVTAELKTVVDVERYSGGRQSFQRIQSAFDELTNEVIAATGATWEAEAAALVSQASLELARA